jgi:hypothetical protein
MLIRNRIIHYRKRIPSALVELFGRKEVTKSLHTTDPLRGARLKSQLDGQIESLFQACRFSNISPQDAKARLQAILIGNSQAAQPQEQSSAVVIVSPSRRRGKRLSDAIDAFSKEKEHSWTLKTKKEYSGVFNQLLNGLNDPWL